MAELKDKLVTLEDLKEAYDNTVHLDSDYVTGIKGSAESAHRHGDVSLSPANIGAKAIQSSVSDPSAAGTSVTFISNISQNTQGVITPTKKTVASASQSAAGLMSAADKKKLDGIAAGAQVNSVTGVKGNSESSYRTGNVNLTAADIGAVANNGPSNFRATKLSVSLVNDLYSLRGTVDNSNNTARNGDDISVNFQNTGITVYDHTTGANVWATGPMVTIYDSATVPSSIGTTARNSITRWGNIVTVALWVTLASGIPASDTIIATVPADYRPTAKRYIGGWVSSAQSIEMFSINSNGQIQTATGSATYTGNIRIFATYEI